jgi:hypothetical protein
MVSLSMYPLAHISHFEFTEQSNKKLRVFRPYLMCHCFPGQINRPSSGPIIVRNQNSNPWPVDDPPARRSYQIDAVLKPEASIMICNINSDGELDVLARPDDVDDTGSSVPSPAIGSIPEPIVSNLLVPTTQKAKT